MQLFSQSDCNLAMLITIPEIKKNLFIYFLIYNYFIFLVERQFKAQTGFEFQTVGNWPRATTQPENILKDKKYALCQVTEWTF